MAYVRRRRRGARQYGLSRLVRSYLVGFLWLGVGIAVIAAIVGLTTVLPESTITIGSVQLSTDVFYNAIGFGIGIVFLLTAVRRILKIRL